MSDAGKTTESPKESLLKVLKDFLKKVDNLTTQTGSENVKEYITPKIPVDNLDEVKDQLDHVLKKAGLTVEAAKNSPNVGGKPSIVQSDLTVDTTSLKELGMQEGTIKLYLNTNALPKIKEVVDGKITELTTEPILDIVAKKVLETQKNILVVYDPNSPSKTLPTTIEDALSSNNPDANETGLEFNVTKIAFTSLEDFIKSPNFLEKEQNPDLIITTDFTAKKKAVGEIIKNTKNDSHPTFEIPIIVSSGSDIPDDDKKYTEGAVVVNPLRDITLQAFPKKVKKIIETPKKSVGTNAEANEATPGPKTELE